MVAVFIIQAGALLGAVGSVSDLVYAAAKKDASALTISTMANYITDGMSEGAHGAVAAGLGSGLVTSFAFDAVRPILKRRRRRGTNQGPTMAAYLASRARGIAL